MLGFIYINSLILEKYQEIDGMIISILQIRILWRKGVN